jgi:hypothetical protein
VKRLNWRTFEARCERALLAAGMTLLAYVADIVLTRRLRR